MKNRPFLALLRRYPGPWGIETADSQSQRMAGFDVQLVHGCGRITLARTWYRPADSQGKADAQHRADALWAVYRRWLRLWELETELRQQRRRPARRRQPMLPFVNLRQVNG